MTNLSILSKLGFFGLFLVSACSSPSPVPAQPEIPTWTTAPARSLLDSPEGSTLQYVGIGEDRDAAKAKTKAESFALQNLANECTEIPVGAFFLQDRYDETVGIIYRHFVRVRIAEKDCLGARHGLAPADPALTQQLTLYQNNYDPPEPKESAPLSATHPVIDTAGLFVLRQQIALSKQSSTPSVLSSAQNQVDSFERTNEKLWSGLGAFSDSRPNMLRHQPSAVRETVTERTRLQQQYPATPTPSKVPSQPTSSKKGGKGSRHRGIPAQQNDSPDSGQGSTH